MADFIQLIIWSSIDTILLLLSYVLLPLLVCFSIRCRNTATAGLLLFRVKPTVRDCWSLSNVKPAHCSVFVYVLLIHRYGPLLTDTSEQTVQTSRPMRCDLSSHSTQMHIHKQLLFVFSQSTLFSLSLFLVISIGMYSVFKTLVVYIYCWSIS